MPPPASSLQKFFSPTTSAPLPSTKFFPPPLPMNPDGSPERFTRDACTYSGQDFQPWENDVIRTERPPLMDGMPTFVTLMKGQRGSHTKHTQTAMVLQRPKVDATEQTCIELVEDVPFVAKLMRDLVAMTSQCGVLKSELATSQELNEELKRKVEQLEEQEEESERDSSMSEDGDGRAELLELRRLRKELDLDRLQFDQDVAAYTDAKAQLALLQREVDLERCRLDRARRSLEAEQDALSSRDDDLRVLADDQTVEIAALQEALDQATQNVYALQGENKRLKEHLARLKHAAAKEAEADTLNTVGLDDILLPGDPDGAAQTDPAVCGAVLHPDLHALFLALSHYTAPMLDGGHGRARPFREAVRAGVPGLCGARAAGRPSSATPKRRSLLPPEFEEESSGEFGLTPSPDPARGDAAEVRRGSLRRSTGSARSKESLGKQRSRAPSCLPVTDASAAACDDLSIDELARLLGLYFSSLPPKAPSRRETVLLDLPTAAPEQPPKPAAPLDAASPRSRSPRSPQPIREKHVVGSRSNLSPVYRPCKSIQPDPHLVTRGRSDGKKYTIELVNYDPAFWPEEGGVSYEAKLKLGDAPGKHAQRRDLKTPFNTKYPSRVQLKCKMAAVYAME
eukprot:TRINITY_DN32417_c0_g1_i1.p1 TRINITY_DN32417_c0_g1~~TRINITY_DN32417_c0_g1_i1.p1  ORF type:complete len:653 (+),score=285.80 TRINITY_DN32417_c0_g1_i1:85-1959(+)